MKMKKIKRCYKDMVASARRLLQHFQFPNKNFRDSSRYICHFLRYFKTVMYLFRYYSRNPQLVVYGNL